MSQPEGQIVRVLCVDDNALIVQALNHRLAMEPWLHVVDVLQRADHLAEAAVATSADIVLLDVDMPDGTPSTPSRNSCSGDRKPAASCSAGTPAPTCSTARPPSGPGDT